VDDGLHAIEGGGQAIRLPHVAQCLLDLQPAQERAVARRSQQDAHGVAVAGELAGDV
jgi:hypothetical protein